MNYYYLLYKSKWFYIVNIDDLSKIKMIFSINVDE